MAVVTRADLKGFAPRAAPRVAAALEAHGDDAFDRWGITTAPRLCMFMAHLRVESAGLTTLAENMNYTTAARIHAVWPSRFPTETSALRFVRQPKALANKVYDGRMGNRPGSDDGWLYRGQGLLGVTGLDMFQRIAAHMAIGIDEFRVALTSDPGMVDCAAATFHMMGCLPFADAGDLVGCTKRINGGLTGLTDRRAALTAASRIWPQLREAANNPHSRAVAVTKPRSAALVPATPPPPPLDIDPAPAPTNLVAWLVDLFLSLATRRSLP